jgi:branched-chain amino acid transport system permease protein
MSVRSKKATKQEAVATGASGRHWGILSPDWNWGTLVKAVFLLALLIWPVIYKSMTSSNYVLSVMTQAGLFAMLTVSVGLVLGQAGQLSFGHTAFYGVGAYVCGMLVFELHVHTLAAWIIGALAAGVVALIVGRPVL